jgi:putative SOS response-associated peptidase YedK
MCASFTYKIDVQQLKEIFGDYLVDETSPFDKVEEDLYPHKYGGVLVRSETGYIFTAKRYSLTPSWSKEEKVKWATYNARMNRIGEKTKRLEYIFEVPTWKGAFGHRHCLVPMNNFRESCREGKGAGHIVSFNPSDENILFAAGLYEDWINKATGEVISTFAIITAEPDEFIKEVGHDRSPVFLNIENGKKWLSGFKNPKMAYDFLEAARVRPILTFETVRPLKGK